MGLKKLIKKLTKKIVKFAKCQKKFNKYAKRFMQFIGEDKQGFEKLGMLFKKCSCTSIGDTTVRDTTVRDTTVRDTTVGDTTVEDKDTTVRDTSKISKSKSRRRKNQSIDFGEYTGLPSDLELQNNQSLVEDCHPLEQKSGQSGQSAEYPDQDDFFISRLRQAQAKKRYEDELEALNQSPEEKAGGYTLEQIEEARQKNQSSPSLPNHTNVIRVNTLSKYDPIHLNNVVLPNIYKSSIEHINRIRPDLTPESEEYQEAVDKEADKRIAAL
jgi:hypothetical protein